MNTQRVVSTRSATSAEAREGDALGRASHGDDACPISKQPFAELPAGHRYRASDGFDYAAPQLRAWLVLHGERSTSPMTRAPMAADYRALCPPEPTARYLTCSMLPPVSYWLAAARATAAGGQATPWFGRVPMAAALGCISLAATSAFAERSFAVTDSRPQAASARLRRMLQEAVPAATLASYGAALGHTTADLSLAGQVLLGLGHVVGAALVMAQLEPGD